MMRRPAISAVSVVLLCAAMAALGAADRNIQKWVDEKGVVHYGDAPPPEAVKNGTSVLNEQGVVVRQIPRQLSSDEAAAARLQQELDSRRKAQDSFLLTTYTRASDIEHVRDDQIALIDSQILLARASLSNTELRIDGLTKRLETFRPYAEKAPRRVPDQLAAEVVQAIGERRNSQETLAKHEQRRQQTSTKFDADISRYRELTNRPSIQ